MVWKKGLVGGLASGVPQLTAEMEALKVCLTSLKTSVTHSGPKNGHSVREIQKRGMCVNTCLVFYSSWILAVLYITDV